MLGETLNRTNIKGNIHNAVVESVHPSLEAAFVHIGPDLKGFLPLDEINFKLLPARGEGRKQGRIGQHLHPGQKLMAQVVGVGGYLHRADTFDGARIVIVDGVDGVRVVSGADEEFRLLISQMSSHRWRIECPE